MTNPTGDKPLAPALADFIHLNEEIAALVRARIPLESHLARIGAELPGKAGELSQRIGRRLEAGETLEQAIEIECASMPAIYRATLVAGIESGQLGSALEALVDSASRVDQLRRITGIALLYPMMITIVTTFLLTLIVTKVTPQFQLVMDPRGPFAWLINWRQAVLFSAIIVLCTILIVAAVWWWRSRSVGIARAKGFRYFTWLSGTRGVNYWGQAATFAELLLLVVQRGVPLNHALRLAANVTDDGQLRNAATHLAEDIERGEAVRAATSHAGDEYRSGFPLLIRLALYHSGNRPLLEGGLRQAAAMYRERAIRAAEWYAEYMPILLTVGIGGTLTICFTLLVLWPYAAMLRELAGPSWH